MAERTDKERIDWLAETYSIQVVGYVAYGGGSMLNTVIDLFAGNTEEIRQAIDAAMAAEENERGG